MNMKYLKKGESLAELNEAWEDVPEAKDEDVKDREVVDLRPQWKEITIQIDSLNATKEEE